MLKPEVSVPVALAVGGVVFSIYQLALPPVADARAVDSGNQDLAAAEQQALWASVGVCAGVSLIAGDPTPFIVGGLMAVGLSWWHRHARLVDPLTGRVSDTIGSGAMRAPTELRTTYDAA
jgi:hypothetical protein